MMPWWQLVLVILLIFSQATWLFTDARRHGASPWFWGVLGLIQCPMPLLLYWWFVRRRRSRLP